MRSTLGRLTLAVLAIVAALLLTWQGASFLGRDGQALAPVTGQYYLGESWMTAPTQPPQPGSMLVPEPGAPPAVSGAATATPVATATPMVVELSVTPEPFLADVARDHAIDPNSTYIVVNQNAQRMTVVQDGRVLRTLPVSSGDPDRGWYTPAWSGTVGPYWGTFSANGVTADDGWYLFQAGGSILIHSLPYTVNPDGSKAFQGLDDLGTFPASRGCIRIAPEDATWFTQWDPQGVPIVILPWDGGTGRAG